MGRLYAYNVCSRNPHALHHGYPRFAVAAMKRWLNIAVRVDVARRSLKVASIVGTILALINYWDRIVPYSLDFNAWAKIAMTYCVPYCVSTYASVSAILAGTQK